MQSPLTVVAVIVQAWIAENVSGLADALVESCGGVRKRAQNGWGVLTVVQCNSGARAADTNTHAII